MYILWNCSLHAFTNGMVCVSKCCSSCSLCRSLYFLEAANFPWHWFLRLLLLRQWHRVPSTTGQRTPPTTVSNDKLQHCIPCPMRILLVLFHIPTHVSCLLLFAAPTLSHQLPFADGHVKSFTSQVTGGGLNHNINTEWRVLPPKEAPYFTEACMSWWFAGMSWVCCNLKASTCLSTNWEQRIKVPPFRIEMVSINQNRHIY